MATTSEHTKNVYRDPSTLTTIYIAGPNGTPNHPL